MKSIEVVAAIICHQERVLATQRGYGEFKGYWEFPGGKIESGESRRDALIREIQEELALDIQISAPFLTIEEDYPAFHLNLHCYLCTMAPGQSPTLKEHLKALWLDRQNLTDINWLPADRIVAERLQTAVFPMPANE